MVDYLKKMEVEIMADNTIDTLSLEIESNLNSADKSIDKLAKTLTKLQGSVRGLSNIKLGGATNAISELKKTMSGFQGVGNLEKGITQLQRLSQIKADNMKKAASGISDISEVLKGMNGITVPDLGNLGSELSKIGRVDLSAISRNTKPLKDLADSLRSLSGLENISIPKLETKNINSAVNALGKLSRVDTSNIPIVSNGIEKMVSSMSELQNIGAVDKGINITINALNRLFSVDMSGFRPEIFKSISASISSLANIPDVSGSLNRFMASLQKLANSGGSISAVASELPKLGEALRTTVNRMASARNISDSLNLFVQSIGRLASAGSKTGQTAAGLDNLAQETLKFFQTMANAPKISQNTLKMTQALAKLASAGGKVGTATLTITSSFNKLSGLGSKTASAIKKAANGIASSFSQIGNSGKHLNAASLSFGKLLKSVLPFIGIGQIFNWGKQAMEISSDLTEVQNVVDVTFGDMKQKVEDLSATSITDFGMSELTAKQIASRFQAMGTAMGFSQEKMSDMSIELTKLTADMASFYNVEQSDMARSLQSVFTGETEPMRRYGIDLTQTTLQEYALAKGITTKVSAMSQAEKTMLRYQYVMERTAAAQGDFARTSDTWANQIRILKQSFELLGSTIGGVLINAFKPMISWLNTVMLKVISVVETIANALGAIFGWTLEITPGGATSDYKDISDGIGSIGDSADSTAGSLGDANNQAEKLKRTLMGFDEINKLDDPTESSGSSGGSGGSGSGSGAGSGGDAGTAQLVRTESLIEQYKSDIKSLEELGEYIGECLTTAMNDIPWDTIYEKASGFGTGLAEFLNGLISPELFGALGQTVAGCINTALHVLDSFGETFDWKNFGESLGTGLDTFLQTLDLDLAASTLSKFTDGIAETIISGSEKVSWGDIGNKIAESMNKYLVSTDWNLVGSAVSTGINDIFKLASTWSKKFDFTELGNSVKELVNSSLKDIKWENAITAASNMGSGIAEALNAAIKPDVFGNIGSTIAGVVNTAVAGAYSFLSEADFKQFADSIAHGINTFIDDVGWEDVGRTIGTGLQKALDFCKTLISGLEWGDVKTALEDLWKGIAETVDMGEVGGILLTALGAWLAANAASAIASSVLSQIGSTIATSIAGALATGISTVGFGGVALAIGAAIAAIFVVTKVAEWLQDVDWDAIGKKIDELLTKGIGTIQTVVSAGVKLAKQGWETVSGWLSSLGNAAKGIIEAGVSLIQKGWSSLKDFVGNAVEVAVSLAKSGWSTLKDFVGSTVNAAVSLTRNGWDSLSGFVGNAVEVGIRLFRDGWDTLKSWLGDAKDATFEIGVKIKDSAAELWDGLKSAWNTGADKVFEIGVNIIDEAKEWWGSVKKFWSDETENESLTAYVKINPGSMAEDGETPEGEVTQPSEPQIEVKAKITGYEFPSETDPLNVDVNATAVSFTDKIDAAKKEIGGFASTIATYIDDITGGKTLTGFTSALSWFADQITDSKMISGFISGLTNYEDKIVPSKMIDGFISNLTNFNDTITPAKVISGFVSNLSNFSDKIATKRIIDGFAANAINLKDSIPSKDKTLDMISNLTNRTVQEKVKAPIGMSANFTKRTTEDKVTKPYNLIANFTKRTTADKVKEPYNLVSNFYKRTTADKVKKPYDLIANFIKRTTASKVTNPFGVTANFTNRVDNIPSAKRFISNITASVQSLTKAPGFGGLALTAVFSVLTSGLRLAFRESGGVFSNGSWHPITAYAGGGSPNLGQMFVAREAGPELVGTLGGHTAVMNNDQIVASVSAGVYQAVAAAMSQFAGRNNSGGTPVINVYVGGKKVTDVVVEEVNRRTQATGVCPILT